MAVARDLLGIARRSVQRAREVVCDTRGMSAPMPDFAMPPEASERRPTRLPPGLAARRALGVGVVVAIVAGLVVVAVPAVRAQVRGGEAVAVAERYAQAVADGDVDAVTRALEPDASAGSDVLLRAPVEPTAPFTVDDVRLVAVDGPRAMVRVDHGVGAERGSTRVALVERDGAWHVEEGLLGRVRMSDELALALDVAPGGADLAWSLPGRFGTERREVGAVGLPAASFSVLPGETTDAELALAPTMATSSLAIDALRAHLAACGAAQVPGCPGLPVEIDVQAPIMTWDLDLASRGGSVDVALTLRALVEGGRSQTFVAVDVVLDVALSDDLATAIITAPTSDAALP